MEQLTSIDLFAGIGGIRLGFDQAFRDSLKTVFVSEWDEHAQKTYKANFNDDISISGDITKVEEADIPSFDICLAGFPCQAFSLAGQRKGFTDNYKGMSRGTLFFDVARICALHKPKVIFCENVKGLTIHDKGRTFDIIKGTLEELGYTVHEKVLNSRDFGVPQNRERIYIVAFRNDIDSNDFRFPKPTDSNKRIKDIIEEQPVSVKYYLSDVYVETLRKHRARHEAKGHGFGYEIRDWNDVAGAIVCGGMGRERNLLIDKRQTNITPITHIKGKVNTEGIRKMTPREWARLQGYPDTFKLPLSDVHLYKQLGNSVSVPVIKAIAEQVKKVLNKQAERGGEIMAIRGNKGEWSETYAFMRLLADGKIFAADANLNRIRNMFFPIMKIIREETIGTPYEYRPNHTNAEIEIFLNGTQILRLPAVAFEDEANRLFAEINARGAGQGAFEVVRTEAFIRSIYMNKLKAPSTDKADINIQIHDVNTGFEKVVGFSIKSELGMPPTLLNAGKTTNFIYRVKGMDRRYIAKINTIDSQRKIKDRIQAISDNGGCLVFEGVENNTFNNNLIMIDSQMPLIVAQMLIGYYSEAIADCVGLADYICRVDPLSRSANFYKHKIKEVLCAVALGMKPATPWDGTDEASGGYIIVKTNGDVLAYHIYNRDAFRGYLLNSTKLESGSSSRHGYGVLYEESGEVRIKLNLQIRFI